MKKLLIIFAIVVMLAALLASPVYAAGSLSVSLSSSASTVNRSDTFDITVYAAVDTCGSGGIDVSYNSSVFEMVSSKCLLNGTDIAGSDVFAFENSQKIAANAFRITFKVKSGASLGKSAITVLFKADSLTSSKSINITVECDHSYSNSCDTTCNSCGATRSITHSWNSGTVTKAATCTETGTKKFTCKVCGATTTDTVSKTSHKYDNSCDTDCNVCGATRSTSHSYAWKCDATSHWEECTGCGKKQESSAHTLAETISGNELGHGHACGVCGLIPDSAPHGYKTDCDPQCPDCGFTRTVAHSYSEQWSFDPGGHYHACSICGDKLEKYMHTPGDAATETTDQICTDCGFVIEVAGNHVHKKTGDWLSDDQGHWYLCTCYAYTDPVAHVWDKGKVDKTEGTITYTCKDCGYSKKELHIPETTPEKEDEPQAGESGKEIPQLYFIIFLSVLGASLIGNLVLIICMCTKGRKGKFTK